MGLKTSSSDVEERRLVQAGGVRADLHACWYARNAERELDRFAARDGDRTRVGVRHRAIVSDAGQRNRVNPRREAVDHHSNRLAPVGLGRNAARADVARLRRVDDDVVAVDVEIAAGCLDGETKCADGRRGRPVAARRRKKRDERDCGVQALSGKHGTLFYIC